MYICSLFKDDIKNWGKNKTCTISQQPSPIWIGVRNVIDCYHSMHIYLVCFQGLLIFKETF